ncbi:MAG: Formate dehydrogenase, alpha subunit, archaeal-type, partial [Methanocalculus sp. 52_23]
MVTLSTRDLKLVISDSLRSIERRIGMSDNTELMQYVPTTCPYCGVGCGLNLVVNNGKVVGVEPFKRS